MVHDPNAEDVVFFNLVGSSLLRMNSLMNEINTLNLAVLKNEKTPLSIVEPLRSIRKEINELITEAYGSIGCEPPAWA